MGLVATPGPDMIHVLGRSIGQGSRAGLVAVLGIVCGSSFHALAAAAGIAAVFRHAPLLYEAVRLAGAGYLLWLGIGLLRQSGSALRIEARPQASLARIFRQALLTNLLNPKVALFYLAFLPQFIAAGSGPVWLQIAILATVLNLLTLAIKSGVALSAGQIGDWLLRHPRTRRWQEATLGFLLCGLALRLAWPERR